MRRLVLPTQMYLRRDTRTRGGRSARHLLVAKWLRAFGARSEPIFIASKGAA